MNACEMNYLNSKVNSGLKVGDNVKVVQCSGFPYDVSAFEGRVGFIVEDDTWSFLVSFYNCVKHFSHFNLEKIEKVEAEKPECQFKPFDKVLVRDSFNDPWKASLFSEYKKGVSYPYRTICSVYAYCIPYEGNEHLVGKTE